MTWSKKSKRMATEVVKRVAGFVRVYGKGEGLFLSAPTQKSFLPIFPIPICLFDGEGGVFRWGGGEIFRIFQ